MSGEDLIALSNAQAAVNSQGAVIATVSDIRAIAPPHDPSTQLFRVYEDPTPALPGHAVIRFDEAHKPLLALAREDLKKAFKTKV